MDRRGEACSQPLVQEEVDMSQHAQRTGQVDAYYHAANWHGCMLRFYSYI
jgi:hypothetical protein